MKTHDIFRHGSKNPTSRKGRPIEITPVIWVGMCMNGPMVDGSGGCGFLLRGSDLQLCRFQRVIHSPCCPGRQHFETEIPAWKKSDSDEFGNDFSVTYLGG